MIDVFKIKFYWNGRKETSFQLANRIYQLFYCLSIKYPFWSEWYIPSKNKKDSLNTPFSFDLDNIESHLRFSTKNQDVDNEGFSKLGFNLGLFKTDDNHNEYGLSFFGGYADNLFPNNCILSFWDPSKFCKSEVLELIKSIIMFLDVDYGCLDSNEFEELIEDSENEIGWISLSKIQVEQSLLPNSIICESISNDKFLYYLKDDDKYFDYSKMQDFQQLKSMLSV